MTRNDRLRKLGNAVREYRGMYHPVSKKWMHPRKVHKLDRVKHWLAELRADVEAGVKFIDECQTWQQFRDWIGKL